MNRVRYAGGTSPDHEAPAPSPISIPPEALMRVRFIRPGKMAQAIASHLPARHQFASEVVPVLWQTAAAGRGRSRTGERP
jgi:hypothetical protein